MRICLASEPSSRNPLHRAVTEGAAGAPYVTGAVGGSLSGGPASAPSRALGPAHEALASPMTRGFRDLPTDLQSSAYMCLKQRFRSCPPVSFLETLHVIGHLVFAKSPEGPWLQTLARVSHLGSC